LPGLDAQVLVPNERHAARALSAGADHLVFVVSASDEHNIRNVRRSTQASLDECRAIANLLPSGCKLRIDIATAFDCPYRGRIYPVETLALLAKVVSLDVHEVCLCDTTGRALPNYVSGLFESLLMRFSRTIKWAFHGHDTYGLGLANVLAAYQV